MAERRMFAKTIVLSDAFLDMPLSARCLYFTFGMLADDDGFVNSPKSIMRQSGASNDDLNLLIAKKFILTFDSGVIVIKHWRINNYLRNDRYKETTYLEEKNALVIQKNGIYDAGIPNGIPAVSPSGIPSIDKDRLDKVSIGEDRLDNILTPSDALVPPPLDLPQEDTKSEKAVKNSKKCKYGEYHHVLLSGDEYEKLTEKLGADMRDICIEYLDSYIEEKGYKSKSHYLSITRWVVSAVEEREKRQANIQRQGTGRETYQNKTAAMLEDSYQMMQEWANEMEAKRHE